LQSRNDFVQSIVALARQWEHKPVYSRDDEVRVVEGGVILETME